MTKLGNWLNFQNISKGMNLSTTLCTASSSEVQIVPVSFYLSLKESEQSPK